MRECWRGSDREGRRRAFLQLAAAKKGPSVAPSQPPAVENAPNWYWRPTVARADAFGLMCIHYDQPDGAPLVPNDTAVGAAQAVAALGKAPSKRVGFATNWQLGPDNCDVRAQGLTMWLVRFHFQVRTGTHIMMTEFVDLPDTEAARIEAAKRVGSLLHEHVSKLWADEEWQMDVTDDKGLILFAISTSAMRSAATSRLKISAS